ncbi:hypothetical protein MVEN_01912800 [Mycena venus]|uniref:Uncharacterized protein n=1 Tax=Mycena venus TaxID=2733690 RepID=A0A8H6XG53_9AGAR|nr:hypothetical protein MVEN_01912800 [Mycena venus]
MPPSHWPSEIRYISTCSYHSSVSKSTRTFLIQADATKPKAESEIVFSGPTSVAIRRISESTHPACGQLGLYATKKIKPNTHIIDYIGEIHCDEREESDYDLSLYRSADLNVGIDASKMGNEGRFVNDYRGIPGQDKPNAMVSRRSLHSTLVPVYKELRAHGLSPFIALNASITKYPVFPPGASAKSAPYMLRLLSELRRTHKKVYFQLARKYHPDTSTDKSAQDKFVEIQAAYDILKDDKKRQMYDQYGATSQEPGFDPNAFSGFGGFQGFGGSPFGKDSDLPLEEAISRCPFESLFLKLAKALHGKSASLPSSTAPPCSGSGLKPGAKRSTCSTCKGTGTRTFVIDSGFQMASTCNTCSGTGSTVPRSSECSHCGGVGKVRTKTNVTVDIAPGVEDGMTLRMPKRGDAPISGKGNPGDLLYEYQHWTGMSTCVYPEELSKTREMVLKGRGVPSPHGGDGGDLFVAFSVQLPRSLTNRQRELIQQYADDIEGRSSNGTSNESSTDDDNATKNETLKRSSEEKSADFKKANEKKRRATA